MTELAKWVWIIIIVIFFVGTDILWILGVSIVVGLLILWLKPEWYDKLNKRKEKYGRDYYICNNRYYCSICNRRIKKQIN